MEPKKAAVNTICTMIRTSGENRGAETLFVATVTSAWRLGGLAAHREIRTFWLRKRRDMVDVSLDEAALWAAIREERAVFARGARRGGYITVTHVQSGLCLGHAPRIRFTNIGQAKEFLRALRERSLHDLPISEMLQRREEIATVYASITGAYPPIRYTPIATARSTLEKIASAILRDDDSDSYSFALRPVWGRFGNMVGVEEGHLPCLGVGLDCDGLVYRSSEYSIPTDVPIEQWGMGHVTTASKVPENVVWHVMDNLWRPNP